MPIPVLPKRCPYCARKVVKQPDGSWLCDPETGGCGWTDRPRALQAEGEAPPENK